MNGLRSAELLLERLPSAPDAPDPGDTYIIAMAMASSADILVTGDKALLSMKHVGPTRIISAQRFAAMLAR